MSTKLGGFAAEILFLKQLPATNEIRCFELLINSGSARRCGRSNIRHIVDLIPLKRIGAALPKFSVLQFRLQDRAYLWSENCERRINEVHAWQSLYNELQNAASVVFHTKVYEITGVYKQSSVGELSVVFEPVSREQ